MIAVGTAPVDIIPHMNTVGNPDVVLPVPINPKFGKVNCARVELFNAPRATFVTAPNVVSPFTTDPATVPILEIMFELPLNPTNAKLQVLVVLLAEKLCAVDDMDTVAVEPVALIVNAVIEPEVDRAKNADPYELIPLIPDPAAVAIDTAPRVADVRFVAAEAKNELAACTP